MGVLLAKVRDRKLYAALHHPDMETYASSRLGLQRASLYRYLQVHDWIQTSHPEWLAPKPKGFIPDLADAFALIWIEKRLAGKDLDPPVRAELEALRDKALAGLLSKQEFESFRRHGHRPAQGLRAFLSRLRLLRKRGSDLSAMPAGVLSALDGAIEILRAAVSGRVQDLRLGRPFAAKKNRRRSFRRRDLRQSLPG